MNTHFALQFSICYISLKVVTQKFCSPVCYGSTHPLTRAWGQLLPTYISHRKEEQASLSWPLRSRWSNVESYLFKTEVFTTLNPIMSRDMNLPNGQELESQKILPRLPRPWDSPGKNTGVGCHFLLQCMKVKSEREVAQSCPTLCDPMDCSPPGSNVHGIFQTTVLEWGCCCCYYFIPCCLPNA